MKRSDFIKMTGTGMFGTAFLGSHWLLAAERSNAQYPELGKHKIARGELVEINFRWPRFVGKNGKIDFHGQYKKDLALKLFTDQGATGWGLSNKKTEELLPLLVGKKVSELISPETGIAPGLDRSVDFALHDLMGNILEQPVYQLIGNKGSREVPVYSGMIYLDELNPENAAKGVDAILENCEWDYNYGYRQLKMKIGRSGRWYPHRQGLDKDIEVVRQIHRAFKGRNTGLLVDANDMYSLDDTIAFLQGIQDVPLIWVEEPFREEAAAGRRLRKWMDGNGFQKTWYADGEANPDHELCLQLGREKVMDVFLPDTFGYGFTSWIKLMPRLQKMGMLASPHAWGNRLKTHYTVHLAAGLGNVATVEGVTCLSDDIEYGDYPIVNGKIKVSIAPGFGMKLLK